MVLTVFLRISKNFRGAAGQRASGPFFQNHSFPRSPRLTRRRSAPMPKLTKLQRKHNQERTNRAAEIIQDYKGRITGEDAAICLRDLLTDLMHFAKSKHLNIEAEFV